MGNDNYGSVWLSRNGYWWSSRPNAVQEQKYGPFTEYKAVPADAIDVIVRGDLPEVTVNRNGDMCVGGFNYGRVTGEERVRDLAYRWLAVAEYLRENPPENPPVDEGQVKAVTAALYEATSDPVDIEVPDVARRLVQAGVRVEVTR